MLPLTDFGPRELLNCYAHGIFPMAESAEDEDFFFVDPDLRGIIPLGGLHISKSLAKTVRSGKFDVRSNTAFEDVIAACAKSMPGREETWINPPIKALYAQLHYIGHAHSVECWQDGDLVGGLYGVTLGGAFFGESMFSGVRDASKTALVHLVGRLNANGFSLLDTQFITPHLERLGAIEIYRDEYRSLLDKALKTDADFTKTFDDAAYRLSVTQSNTQIS